MMEQRLESTTTRTIELAEHNLYACPCGQTVEFKKEDILLVQGSDVERCHSLECVLVAVEKALDRTDTKKGRK